MANLREADLAAANLTGADLPNWSRGVGVAAIDGVRWSSETVWPVIYREAIRRRSDLLADGTYEVQDTGVDVDSLRPVPTNWRRGLSLANKVGTRYGRAAPIA
jgi:hypothetical protein